MSELTKLLLHGARGRMGQAIQKNAAGAGCEVLRGADEGDALDFTGCEVAVDFSSPAATVNLVEGAARALVPVVIGTTGHSEEERGMIREAGQDLPIVWAGNFSVGVTLLRHLVELAARALPEGFDIEIVEMHHGQKKDAPSGTAMHLLDAAKEGRKDPGARVTHGREGQVGARPRGEIGVHALRGGDIVGEHTVLFAGPGERLELTHKASDRAIFALGALRAARWVIGQPPGLYDMHEVLELR